MVLNLMSDVISFIEGVGDCAELDIYDCYCLRRKRRKSNLDLEKVYSSLTLKQKLG